MIDINSLPRLPIPERHNLPEIGAVYFVLNEASEVEYIGIANSLKARWMQHHCAFELDCPKRCFVAWIEIEKPEERSRLEIECIKKYKPRINSNFRDDVRRCGNSRKVPKIVSQNPDLITIAEAAELTNKSVWAIQKNLHRKKLEVVIKIQNVNYLSRKQVLSREANLYKRESRKCPNL